MITLITEHGYGTGGIPDEKDKRDYHFDEIAGDLPPFDWTAGYDIEVELTKLIGTPVLLPVKDQGNSFSCGGQSFSSYGNVLTTVFDRKLEDRSAKFIYAQGFVPGGGSAGRDVASVVTNKGWAHEAKISSYENGNPPSEAFMEDGTSITSDVLADASSDKALSYAQTDTDIESVAQAIKANYGVVLGVTGANNGTWRSAMPIPPKNGDTMWHHWLYAGRAKMIAGKRCIGVLNSWGVNTGYGGWQWLSEDYFSTFIGGQSTIFNCWTLVFNPTKPNPDFQHYFGVDINFGDAGPEVKALQTALQVNGQFPRGVPTTGNYQDITRQAVLSFQQRYVSPVGPWQQFLVWCNQGKHVSKLTRDKLNQLFAPLK